MLSIVLRIILLSLIMTTKWSVGILEQHLHKHMSKTILVCEKPALKNK